MPTQNDTAYVPPKEAVLFHNLVADYERYQCDGQSEVANDCLNTLIDAIRRHQNETRKPGSFSNGGLVFGPTLALVGERAAPCPIRTSGYQQGVAVVGIKDIKEAYDRAHSAIQQLQKVSKVDPYRGPSLEKLREVLSDKTHEIGAGDLVFLNEDFDGSTYIVQFIDGERIRIRPCREIALGKAGLLDRIVHRSELGFIRKAGDFPAIVTPDRERTETSPPKPG